MNGYSRFISKRVLDVLLATCGLLVICIPMLVICVIILSTSQGPVLFWSKRVGKNNVIFNMPKFRSMHIETPILPTHLLSDPNAYLTSFGRFLRKTSLDELPQLWCILKGEMSVVGPRPALPAQIDLIKMRTENGVSRLSPGLTGWAQVNGRDNITDQTKATYDYEYLRRSTFLFDMRIIWLTLCQALSRVNVSH